MNPFDYVNSINSSKKENLMIDEVAEKAYNPWLINKALSYFKDTVLYANEINGVQMSDIEVQDTEDSPV